MHGYSATSDSGRWSAVASRVDLFDQLGEEVVLALVDERVHGVEPQAVEVVVAQPVTRVVEQEPADRSAVGSVEVDGVTPWRLMSVGRVRTEPVQVVTARSEVVVHDIEQHADPSRVRRIDETLEPVRSAIGLVHRVEQHTVVSPASCAIEGVDRHELDQIDTEIDQVVEVRDGAVEVPASENVPTWSS